MQDQWTYWIPIKGLDQKYDLHSFLDNNIFFKIIFFSQNNSHQLEVLFERGVGSYEINQESIYLEKLSTLTQQYGLDFFKKWTFFKINDSRYLKFLSQQSHTISDTRNFIHFSMVTERAIINIIATQDPLIKIISKK